MLKEKYNVVISRGDKIEVKSFKENMKNEAEKYFNTLVESLHKKGVEDWNGAALVENNKLVNMNQNSVKAVVGAWDVDVNEYHDRIEIVGPDLDGYSEFTSISRALESKFGKLNCKFDDKERVMTIIKNKINESINSSYNILKTDGYADAYWDMILKEDKNLSTEKQRKYKAIAIVSLDPHKHRYFQTSLGSANLTDEGMIKYTEALYNLEDYLNVIVKNNKYGITSLKDLGKTTTSYSLGRWDGYGTIKNIPATRVEVIGEVNGFESPHLVVSNCLNTLLSEVDGSHTYMVDTHSLSYLNENINTNKLYEEIEIDLDSLPPKNPSIDFENYGEDCSNGIANLLIAEINNCWNSITNYNNLIEQSKEQDHMNFIDVLAKIVKDQHNHIGQLQELLKTIKPETSEIMQGEIDAKKYIDELISDEPVLEYKNEPDPEQSYIAKASALKYDNNDIDLNDSNEIADKQIDMANIHKILNYFFGTRLEKWDGTEDNLKVSLITGETLNVEIENSSYGVKLINKDTGEEILPIDALEYPEQPIEDSNFKPLIQKSDLENNQDDLDYIDNF